jgi:dihydrofolate reductase
MGHITSGLFISLDGVVEAPQTWHFPYADHQLQAAVGELMSGSDAMLLGRRTYEEFAAYWPGADPGDPMTAAMNGTQKYVVSTTLTEATWQNTTLVSGDVDTELAKLKTDTRLATTGSATLVRRLLERGLLDELHLLVHPIVVGHGVRLFPEGPTVPLTLLSSTTFDSGVLHLVYTAARPAAGVEPGPTDN